MKIQSIRQEATADYIQWVAKISWEQNDFPTHTYYFRVGPDNAALLGHPADAFFCAALVPALANGEARLWIDEPVCPTLLDGVNEALFWITTWYQDKYRQRPALQLDAQKRATAAPTAEGACLFMSGGLDACFSLLHNLEHYPSGHPGRFRQALFINGFDIGGKRDDANSPLTHQKAAQALGHVRQLCDQFDLPLCHIETNIRHLDDTSGFWGREFCGAALAACAHAVAGLGRHFYLSADGAPLIDHTYTPPYGNHVALTHCYSSYTLELHQYLTQFDSRIGRLRKVSEYPDMLRYLRVCFAPPEQQLNCGHCEKCIRTMLGLYALDKLDHNAPFSNPLTPALVQRVIIDNEIVAGMYQELLTALQQRNDPTYPPIIIAKLRQFTAYNAWKNETNWKGRIKRFDRKWLNGAMGRLLHNQLS